MSRNRTGDTKLSKRVLYQLSYQRITVFETVPMARLFYIAQPTIAVIQDFRRIAKGVKPRASASTHQTNQDS